MTPRLLVLDDDPTILALLRSYFGGLGWTVAVCAAAEEGLGLIDSDTYDAVICDLHFGPGRAGEGFELISRARQRWPRAAVLLFTGADGNGVRSAALKAGADRVLPKPAPLALLREATVAAMVARQ